MLKNKINLIHEDKVFLYNRAREAKSEVITLTRKIDKLEKENQELRKKKEKEDNSEREELFSNIRDQFMSQLNVVKSSRSNLSLLKPSYSEDKS